MYASPQICCLPPCVSSQHKTQTMKHTVIFILDTSGSMSMGRGMNANVPGAGKLGAAKHLIRQMMTQDPSADFKVLPFIDDRGSGRNHHSMHASTYPTLQGIDRDGNAVAPVVNSAVGDQRHEPWWTTRSHDVLLSDLHKMTASGGTPLFEKTTEGVHKALEIARRYEAAIAEHDSGDSVSNTDVSKVYKVSVYILTDGQASDGEPHISSARKAIADLLATDEQGNPRYASDVSYYYAAGEGGDTSGRLMGIPDANMFSFHNSEQGIGRSGAVTRERGNLDRLVGATPANFRSMARSRTMVVTDDVLSAPIDQLRVLIHSQIFALKDIQRDEVTRMRSGQPYDHKWLARANGTDLGFVGHDGSFAKLIVVP